MFRRVPGGRCALAMIAAAAVFLAGCQTAVVPDVATHIDPSTHIRTDLIPENLLETSGSTRELLWLNASRVFKDYQNFDYYLEVHYEAMEETGLLKINPGSSLTVIANGQEVKFRGSGGMNPRSSRRGIVSEDAIYPVSGEDLRLIAYSDTLTVRVSGANGVLTREFQEVNFDRFRKFVAQFVETVE
ncbi:MAG: hypothetical protein K9N62_19495 [Verrucomicrobia bacterium]|jgi:hypothetical protein|nr:hypothetical protein [Verrucomicrobiota bacterium]